jgi:hypothetical protein
MALITYVNDVYDCVNGCAVHDGFDDWGTVVPNPRRSGSKIQQLLLHAPSFILFFAFPLPFTVDTVTSL